MAANAADLEAARAGGMSAPLLDRLGLDADRCWIITSEVNQFVWPGPDIRLVPLKSDRTPFYGKIPAKLLEKMREVISANVEQGCLKITPRSQ